MLYPELRLGSPIRRGRPGQTSLLSRTPATGVSTPRPASPARPQSPVVASRCRSPFRSALVAATRAAADVKRAHTPVRAAFTASLGPAGSAVHSGPLNDPRSTPQRRSVTTPTVASVVRAAETQSAFRDAQHRRAADRQQADIARAVETAISRGVHARRGTASAQRARLSQRGVDPDIYHVPLSRPSPMRASVVGMPVSPAPPARLLAPLRFDSPRRVPPSAGLLTPRRESRLAVEPQADPVHFLLPTNETIHAIAADAGSPSGAFGSVLCDPEDVVDAIDVANGVELPLPPYTPPAAYPTIIVTQRPGGRVVESNTRLYRLGERDAPGESEALCKGVTPAASPSRHPSVDSSATPSLPPSSCASSTGGEPRAPRADLAVKFSREATPRYARSESSDEVSGAPQPPMPLAAVQTVASNGLLDRHVAERYAPQLSHASTVSLGPPRELVNGAPREAEEPWTAALDSASPCGQEVQLTPSFGAGESPPKLRRSPMAAVPEVEPGMESETVPDGFQWHFSGSRDEEDFEGHSGFEERADPPDELRHVSLPREEESEDDIVPPRPATGAVTAQPRGAGGFHRIKQPPVSGSSVDAFGDPVAGDESSSPLLAYERSSAPGGSEKPLGRRWSMPPGRLGFASCQSHDLSSSDPDAPEADAAAQQRRSRIKSSMARYANAKGSSSLLASRSSDVLSGGAAHDAARELRTQFDEAARGNSGALAGERPSSADVLAQAKALRARVATFSKQ